MSDDTIDFTQWGPDGTVLADGVAGVTVGGVHFTVNGPGGGYQILREGGDWDGSYAVNASVLWDTFTPGPGPIALNFIAPISGLTGLSATPNMHTEAGHPAYTATMTAYAGATVIDTFTISGPELGGSTGTAPNMTVSSGSANITKITFTVSGLCSGGNVCDLQGIGLGPVPSSPPPPAKARRPTDVAWVSGLNPPIVPPPVGYTTSAVAFDGTTTYLNTASLTASASTPNFSFSIWLWLATGSFTGTPAIFVVDPVTTYTNSLTATFGGYMEMILNDVTGITDSLTVADDGAPLHVEGAWTHFLFSAETNFASGSKIAGFFVNGVDFSHIVSDLNPSFNMVFNALPFYIGDDTFGDIFHGYMADAWIAPGQSLLSGGTIPPATVAKFISSGKPVSLGTRGQTPTGTAPAIFLRLAPSASPSTFATNLGTGGNFTVTGALTTAPSSPSD